MSKVHILGRFISVALLLFAPKVICQGYTASPQVQGGLVLKPEQLVNVTKIVKIELHVQGGFTAISHIPLGWQVSIDNSSASQGVMTATANSDDAGITEKVVKSFQIQVSVGSAIQEPQVWAFFSAIDGKGVRKKIPLSSFSFMFLPDYPRHRLYIEK